MTKKFKILSQENLARTAATQPFFVFLSIIQNFSLGLLCLAFHKKPSEVAHETVDDEKEDQNE